MAIYWPYALKRNHVGGNILAIRNVTVKPVSKVSMTYASFGGGKLGSHMRNVFTLQTRGILGEGVGV